MCAVLVCAVYIIHKYNIIGAYERRKDSFRNNRCKSRARASSRFYNVAVVFVVVVDNHVRRTYAHVDQRKSVMRRRRRRRPRRENINFPRNVSSIVYNDGNNNYYYCAWKKRYLNIIDDGDDSVFNTSAQKTCAPGTI